MIKTEDEIVHIDLNNDDRLIWRIDDNQRVSAQIIFSHSGITIGPTGSWRPSLAESRNHEIHGTLEEKCK